MMTCLKYIFAVTALGLIYIHMQMTVFDLAYQGKDKEKRIKSLIEDNGNITYKILTLKSANNLGLKMLAEDSSMRFIDPDNVIEVSLKDDTLTPARNEPSPAFDDSRVNTLLSFVSFSGIR